MLLEANEYIGLSLGVKNILTTLSTNVKPMYDLASILIVDNDPGKLITFLVYKKPLTNHRNNCTVYMQQEC